MPIVYILTLFESTERRLFTISDQFRDMQTLQTDLSFRVVTFITCKYNYCFKTQVENSENFTFFPPPVTDFGLIWNMAEDKIVPTPLSSFLQKFGLKSLRYYSLKYDFDLY